MFLAALPIVAALSLGQTVRLYDEGVLLGPVVGIDCVGTGIVCSWSSSLVRGTLTVTSGSGYSTIEDEATPLTQRTTVNFTGAGVSCVDSGGKTVCTISGGGGGGTSPLILSFGGF